MAKSAPARLKRDDTTQTTHESVLKRYRALIESDAFSHDPAQLKVVEALDKLNKDLAERRLANKKSSLGWLFSKRKSAWTDVSGLYIWGGVGRGKTMLMDMFFETSSIRRKRRIHFHEFMADIHERIYHHRKKVKAGEVKDVDPIGPVANDLADEVRLLCFDEFTVRDVADAMIMRRLFSALFEHDVVVVATSNVDPDDLYKDGLRRGDFIPFIELLKSRTQILHLDAKTDYRLDKLSGKPVFSHPLNEASHATLEETWSALVGQTSISSAELHVKGRIVKVPRTALGIARFTFADLCEAPLGASDYLKIAKSFHTILLENIPVLTAAKRNEAKRFITLVDALYDSNVKLIATAAAAPQDLNKSLRDVEAFEFDRTVSRLIEMQSEDYLSQPHSVKFTRDDAIA